jgi:hydroxyethylthiazole kinase-like uncharacterized protein yjeF
LFTPPCDTLILCGPGNNGADGKAAARHLERAGFAVSTATLETIASAPPATLLIDCLFGTGLKRPLEANVSEDFLSLAKVARVRVACDLPSGVASDDGRLLSPIPHFDLTVTFGALKPAHRLSPAIHAMGRLVLADIGISAKSQWHEIGAPLLPPLDPEGHKYDRGLVHCLAGAMPGAMVLAASAAARAGAGYVRVTSPTPLFGLPSAVVQDGSANLDDPRIGALLVGPGMGHRPDLLDRALTSGRPMVIDADALRALGDPGRLAGRDSILTPHHGEFMALFGDLAGSKPERALSAAQASGSVVVYKGADTLVASPDGRIGFSPPAPAWLASAGTGDVLAGIIAAFRARGLAAFEAACAGVWVHRRAAQLAGPAMIADDLVAAIPGALR